MLQDFPAISFIHASGPKPSRKREEAQALENLRKRVEQSKLYKANQVVDPAGSASSSNAQLNNECLDNRPRLLKKVNFNKIFNYTGRMLIAMLSAWAMFEWNTCGRR